MSCSARAVAWSSVQVRVWMMNKLANVAQESFDYLAERTAVMHDGMRHDGKAQAWKIVQAHHNSRQ